MPSGWGQGTRLKHLQQASPSSRKPLLGAFPDAGTLATCLKEQRPDPHPGVLSSKREKSLWLGPSPTSAQFAAEFFSYEK